MFLYLWGWTNRQIGQTSTVSTWPQFLSYKSSTKLVCCRRYVPRNNYTYRQTIKVYLSANISEKVKLRLTKTSRGKKALSKIGFELVWTSFKQVLNWLLTGFELVLNLFSTGLYGVSNGEVWKVWKVWVVRVQICKCHLEMEEKKKET